MLLAPTRRENEQVFFRRGSLTRSLLKIVSGETLSGSSYTNEKNGPNTPAVLSRLCDG